MINTALSLSYSSLLDRSPPLPLSLLSVTFKFLFLSSLSSVLYSPLCLSLEAILIRQRLQFHLSTFLCVSKHNVTARQRIYQPRLRCVNHSDTDHVHKLFVNLSQNTRKTAVGQRSSRSTWPNRFWHLGVGSKSC